jgi:KDO2-lipid IV(A) lauroyltransferase
MKKRINIMGSKVFYYLFVIPLSRMPYFILYRVSDFVYFLMYYIIGYRKKVIVDNISKSFPAKSSEEITKIVKKFYSHFCDLK